MAQPPPASGEAPLAEPGPTQERHGAMDALRGVAVLGILVMNIQAFSMVMAAYLNPPVQGGFEGANYWVWLLSHIFAQEKFLTIFSMLFGAGIVLMAERNEAKGLSPFRMHLRRNTALLFIGAAHGYLLWYGDILLAYALAGFAVYRCRHWASRRLVIAGVALLCLPALYMVFSYASIPYWPDEARQEVHEMLEPPPGFVAMEVATYQGGWLDQMRERVPTFFMISTFYFLIYTGWRVAGLMLLGMALYKWGVLQGMRSRRFYGGMLALGLGIGLPMVSGGVLYNNAHGWEPFRVFYMGALFNYWGSLPAALGWIAGLMLLWSVAGSRGALWPLQAAGRMALSNYLLQTLICTTLFYGHGLGWFGEVERTGQIAVVGAIWVVCLVFSVLWLRAFRMGPAEWAWRCLTYRQLLPLRRGAPEQEQLEPQTNLPGG